MKKGQIADSRPRWLTLLCRPLMTKPSFECKAVWFEPSTATFEIRLDTVSSDSITSIRFIISQCVLGCFSLRLCWLLLGIRLAVTTAQSLNGLQSRIFFFLLLVCLFLLLQNLWKLSVCVSIMWECMDECAWNWLGHRVDLQGNPHHLSTSWMSLSLWLQASSLPRFFARHVCSGGSPLLASNCHTRLGL